MIVIVQFALLNPVIVFDNLYWVNRKQMSQLGKLDGSDDKDILESLNALESKISYSLNNHELKIIMIDGSVSGFAEKSIN